MYQNWLETLSENDHIKDGSQYWGIFAHTLILIILIISGLKVTLKSGKDMIHSGWVFGQQGYGQVSYKVLKYPRMQFGQPSGQNCDTG